MTEPRSPDRFIASCGVRRRMPPGGRAGPRLALLWLMFVVGCSAMMESTVDRYHEDDPVAEDSLEVVADFAARSPRVVAVLPFENATEDPEAAPVLRRLFYGNFSSLPFRDVELGRIDAALGDGADLASAAVAAQVGADAFVRGRVLRFERNYYGVYADLVTEVEWEMVRVEDGEVLWKARVDEANRNVTLSLSPLGLAMGMAENVWQISRAALVQTANKACRRAVASIPVPAALGDPPRILDFLHDGLGRVLKQGDRLEVALEATPGIEASFSVPGVREGVPMREDGEVPGRYRGSLAVPDGLELEGIVLEATVRNDRGESARWVDVLGPVRVDTLPPDPVAGVTHRVGDGRVELAWDEGGEADLAEFRVLRSTTPLQGYAAVGNTQYTRFEDSGLVNGKPYYYRIVAVDRVGNEAQPSARVEALPVAPGPRPVRGTIAADTTWPAAGGPYVLQGAVEVAVGYTLTLEPGTRVLGTPGSSLQVRGALLAAGTETQRIEFEAEGAEPWQGLVLEGSGADDSRLVYVRVVGARTGVLIRDASPTLKRVRVADSDVGVVVTGAEAKPKCARLLVHDNLQGGVRVVGLAQPTVAQSKILHNVGPGVWLEAAGGIFFQNQIVQNGGGGVFGSPVGLRAGYNQVRDNQVFELNLTELGRGFPELELNFWGAPETLEAVASESVPVTGLVVLAAADGEATVELPLLPGTPPEGVADGLWIRRLPVLAHAGYRPAGESPFVQGIEALEEGDAQRAAAAFEEAAELMPNDPETLFWLGTARLAAGAPEAAAEALQKACVLNVRSVEYRLRLASAYRAGRQWREAELTYSEVLRLDPDNAEAAAALRALEERRSGAGDTAPPPTNDT